MTTTEEDLLIEGLLIEDLSIEDLLIETHSFQDTSKEYHFYDCEEKAHLLIDYFANVILKDQEVIR